MRGRRVLRNGKVRRVGATNIGDEQRRQHARLDALEADLSRNFCNYWLEEPCRRRVPWPFALTTGSGGEGSRTAQPRGVDRPTPVRGDYGGVIPY